MPLLQTTSHPRPHPSSRRPQGGSRGAAGVVAFALVLLICAAAWPACGGRTDTSMLLATDAVAQGGGAAAGGPGGEGPGGTGGEGGGEGGQGGEGGGGFQPIDCLACIALECPAVLDCLLDPACLQGLGCVVTSCLGGAGGPDPMCMFDCFNGDMEAAMAALEAITCVFDTCGDSCSGGIPLPGF